MKKPLIVSIEELNRAMEAYNNSESGRKKLESAKKAYDRDKVWLKPFLEAHKSK
jgi:hypothetical protein